MMTALIISVKVFVIASVIKAVFRKKLFHLTLECPSLILTRHAHSNSLCVGIMDQQILFSAGDSIISYKQRQIVLN